MSIRDLSRREISIDLRALPPWISRHRMAVLIGLGIVFRMAQYLANRPYWMDESALAGNIRRETPAELFGPLSQTQLAPPGFLALEWAARRVLGDNPFALRGLPLMGGIASLFLFRRLAERLLRPGAAVIAMALFAACDDLIYFASELKQYSTDLAVTMGCTLMGLSCLRRPWNTGRLMGVAAAGIAAEWCSHPAAFVLAGVGVAWFLEALRERRWTQAGLLIPVGLAWAASIAALRVVSMRQLGQSRDMWAFWDFAFPPWPPASLADALWPVRRGLYLFVNPLDYHWPLRPGLMVWLPCVLCLAGCASLAGRGAAAFATIALPAGFALLAAYLRWFPFHGRLILFLVPAIFLAMGEGADWADQVVNRRWFRPLLLAALLLFPVLGDVYHLAVPRIREGLNPFGDRRPYPDPDKHPGWNPERFPS